LKKGSQSEISIVSLIKLNVSLLMSLTSQGAFPFTTFTSSHFLEVWCLKTDH